MAKTNAPFFSLSAHGTFARQLIFETDKGRQRVKKYKKPQDKKTQAQLVIRTLNSSAVAVWKLLTGLERAYFRQAVWTPHFHGYHYFMHQYITRVRAGKIPYFEAPMKLALDWTAGNRRAW